MKHITLIFKNGVIIRVPAHSMEADHAGNSIVVLRKDNAEYDFKAGRIGSFDSSEVIARFWDGNVEILH